KDTLPPSFDLRKFERETALLLALDQCLSASRAIESDVHDTFLAIGKNAVQSAKIAFGHLAVGMAAAEALKNSVRLIKGRRSPRAGPAASQGEPAAAAPTAAPATAVPAAPPANPTGTVVAGTPTPASAAPPDGAPGPSVSAVPPAGTATDNSAKNRRKKAA